MHKLKFILLLFSALFFTNCEEEKVATNPFPKETEKIELEDSTLKDIEVVEPQPVCEWDTYLIEKGMVDIQTIDSSILVELKYSTTDNFMGKDMYGCLEKCFLQPDVAEKLKNAQAYLKELNPRLSLLVYDGVRPRSIQQYMWDILDLPINEKAKFVSNPARGSLHNFGAAVDLTIYDLDSLQPLDMGAPYDHIGIEAWPTKEKMLLEEGVLTTQQVNNRKLLRQVMIKAQFFNIQTEWWHFNSCYRNKAYELYEIIEGFETKPE